MEPNSFDIQKSSVGGDPARSNQPAKMNFMRLMVLLFAVSFPLAGCAPEYEVPIGKNYYFGYCSFMGKDHKPTEGYCVLRGDPNTSIGVLVTDVVECGCVGDAIVGRRQSDWFVLQGSDFRSYESRETWMSELTRLGIAEPALRKPPTRFEATLRELRTLNSRSLLTVAGVITLIAVGVIGVIAVRRSHKVNRATR